MSGKILVRSKGSLQLVDSLDGYPGARVVATDVPEPPHPDARWVDGAWAEPGPRAPTVEERLAAVEAQLAELRKAQNGG